MNPYHLFAALLLCWTLYPAAPAAASAVAEVEALRVGFTPGRTRLVFDLSAMAPHRMFTLSDPDRVVIEFAAAKARFDPRQVALQGTPIARIHSAAGPDGSLRYTFDLRQPAEPQTLALAPDHGKGYRVVLDLYPAAEPAVAGGAGPPLPERAARARQERIPPTITPASATRIPNPVSDGGPRRWSGSVSLQSRLFFQDPAYPEQDDQNISLAVQPEYYLDWDGGRQRFALKPFARLDANDDERSHVDLRELYWRIERDRLVFKAGLDVVFWGVAESQHLVDIINQTDFVENLDTEDKLGQPMLNVDYLSDDWGTWQVWLLPYFRERTFPGDDGRLRTEPPVDTDDPIWESGDEDKHIDFALRWSHFIGDWDLGLAHFSGTARTPLLVPAGGPGDPRLRPLYLQIEQTSLDVQATKGAWLWKLEALYNDNSADDYAAAVGGFEYTQFGIRGSAADLGWLLEYHYDDRGEDFHALLQNDLFAGLRLSGNDVAGTRVLAGVTVDLDNGASFGNLEAVRRLGESWTLTVEARSFFNTQRPDPLHFFRADDYVELQLDRYF